MTLSRPRNGKGWIIPREGSVSRAVYECMMCGMTPLETLKIMRRYWGIRDYGMVCTIIYKIKNPKKHKPKRKKQLEFDFGE